MGVVLKRGVAGPDACPRGQYALYEHADFNDKKPARAVIADGAVPSLNQVESWYADVATSVVNKTDKLLELFIHADYGGESIVVKPGESITQLPAPFDNAISSSRLIAVPAGAGGLMGALGQVRDGLHQATGGKVTEPGKAEAGSGVLGKGRDAAFSLAGGQVEKGGASPKLPACVARVKKGDLIEGRVRSYNYSDRGRQSFGGFSMDPQAPGIGFKPGTALFTFRKHIEGWFTSSNGRWLKESTPLVGAQYKYFYSVEKDSEYPNGRVGENFIDGDDILFCDKAEMKTECQNPHRPWNPDKDR